ncbi:MAG: condensation domain-containing protein [Cyclobacteriaceae bacterium]
MENKIDKNNLEDILELTPFQEGLLLHYLRNKSSQYTEQLYLRLSGKIDDAFFAKTWNKIGENNEVLRSFFRWKAIKKPVVIILKDHQPQIEYIDLSNIKENNLEEEIARIRQADIQTEFDLSKVPFRIKLLTISEESHVMLISNHHIMYDGWSTGIILKEFIQEFDQVQIDEESQVNKAKYKDYVIWNQKREKDNELAFWSKYLSRRENNSLIPFANPKKLEPEQLKEGKKTNVFEVDEKLYQSISRFGREYKVTTANILYSAWGLLLGKFNDENVVFGTTVSCRPNTIKGIENTVGLFINTIPLLCEIKPDQELGKFLQDNQKALIDREPYEASSLTDIYDYSKATQGSLFDSIVVIENYPIDKVLSENSSKLKLVDYHMDYQTHYLLSVVISTFNGIHVTLTYNDQVFTPEALSLIEEYFVTILRQITDSPAKKISELVLTS